MRETHWDDRGRLNEIENDQTPQQNPSASSQDTDSEDDISSEGDTPSEGAARKKMDPGELIGRIMGGLDLGGFVSAANFVKLLQERFGKSQQDPLILDLDGDGVQTLGQDSGVLFDHDGNGFAQLTGWAAPTDGLLVWDRNGNGAIDDGSELFGNHTLLASGERAANGFAAPAELDANGDGSVDAGDEAFSALRVWRDLNSDGALGAGELFTLDEQGVVSLNTGYELGDVVDEFGNAHRQLGEFTYADGTTAQMVDVWFAADTARSVPTQWVEEPEDIAALPDATAFGNVYDLHQAMTRDESGALKALVEQFAAFPSIGQAVAACAEADELLLAA